MSETATKLLDQLLQLSEDDRLDIAECLWGSVGHEKFQQIMDDTTNDPEFQAELVRRLKEVEEHPERLLDGEQVFREVREHLERRRQARCNNARHTD